MKRILLTLVVLVAFLVGYVLAGTGFWIEVKPQFEGVCLSVDGVPAAEDIVIDADRGIAYLSSYDTRTAGIYRLDLREDKSEPILAYRRSEGFLPLGISLWASGDERRLFVINRARTTVEWFDIDADGELHPSGRARSDLLPYPNNLVAVGPEEFYATNTHSSEPGSVKRLLDTLFRLRSGSVVRYAAGEWQRAAPAGVGYANGIATNADGKEVYVGSISTWEVYRYRRATDGMLELMDTIPLPGGVDNLTFLEDGILAAVHPRAFDALAHLNGSSPTAPSRIVRFKVNGGAPEIVFEDPGDRIAAAAVAASWGDQLLIGPVKADRFLRCKPAS